MSRARRDVELDCVDWALEIARSFVPDLIVFIAKSGYLFAMPMARVFECNVVDVAVSRPGNDSKDLIAERIPWIPQFALRAALASRANYAYNDANHERKLSFGARIASVDLANYKRILVVDDSVDTGWSMRAVLGYLKSEAPESEIKVASYCVIDSSAGRVCADFRRYTNTIVLTATSRYSSEYGEFLSDYEAWSDGTVPR